LTSSLTPAQNIKLFIADDDTRFIEILRKADKSFVISSQQIFRAINDKGYMVDLITSPKKPIHLRNSFAETLEADLDIAEIEKLEWLISAPNIDAFPIGFDGIPVLLRVPDPRAFTIHKYFVSRQLDRDPIKKKRDATQSKLMLNIISKYLPLYPFSDQALRNFPAALRKGFHQVTREKTDDQLW